jgi:anaerobic selenocysteine-containing dehydrogenase
MQPTTRRQFLKTALATAAAFGLPASPAPAASLPEVAPDDPAAKALGYTVAAAKIDPAKEPTFRKGSSCGTCSLYQAAQEQGGLAPCAIFPGKAVKKGGWCRAWAAKPA